MEEEKKRLTVWTPSLSIRRCLQSFPAFFFAPMALAAKEEEKEAGFGKEEGGGEGGGGGGGGGASTSPLLLPLPLPPLAPAAAEAAAAAAAAPAPGMLSTLANDARLRESPPTPAAEGAAIVEEREKAELALLLMSAALE